jgi:hypothetical protein
LPLPYSEELVANGFAGFLAENAEGAEGGSQHNHFFSVFCAFREHLSPNANIFRGIKIL